MIDMVEYGPGTDQPGPIRSWKKTTLPHPPYTRVCVCVCVRARARVHAAVRRLGSENLVPRVQLHRRAGLLFTATSSRQACAYPIGPRPERSSSVGCGRLSSATCTCSLGAAK